MTSKKERLIIEWNDTRQIKVYEFDTPEALIEKATIAKLLGAKVAYFSQVLQDWVWS